MTSSHRPDSTISATKRHAIWRRLWFGLLSFAVVLSCLLWLQTPAALASLKDDRYDGTIFALYGGNGSLVPPRVSLADSFQRKKPALLVFYLDDSSDCKQFATVVSQLQEFYGRASDFIPISVDSLPPTPSPAVTEPGHYYKGYVPQTVLIDGSGKVVLDVKGQVAFETVDDAFRKVFDLLPRTESVQLKRRPVNEINTELAK